MLKYLFGAILLLCGLLIWQCSQVNEYKLNRVPLHGTILAFGDSLTFGKGTNREQAYPAVLEKLIDRKVINSGVSGDTTATGLQRLPKALELHQPQLVILELGGNDMLRRVPDDVIVKNLNALINLIKTSGAEVLLVATPRASSLSSPKFYQQISEKQQIPLDNTTLEKLLTTRKYKSDAAHLNQAGYTEMAKAIAEKLKQAGAI